MRRTTHYLQWLLLLGLLLGLLPGVAEAKWRKAAGIFFDEDNETVCRDGVELRPALFEDEFDPNPPAAKTFNIEIHAGSDTSGPVIFGQNDVSVPRQTQPISFTDETDSSTVTTHYYAKKTFRWADNVVLDSGDKVFVNVFSSQGFELTATDCFFVVPPKITDEPNDVTINSGQSTTLSVQVTGSSLSYQWYEGERGDTAKKVGTNSRNFTTPNLTQSRRYWVRVSNSAGSVDSRTATVRVITPPSIVQQPVDVIITSGQTTTLSVEANGTTPLEYDWYAGERGNTSQPVGDDTSSFTTPVLTQTTRYWVRVRNAAGSVNSRTTTVTVVTPPSIVQQPVDVTITSGQTASLSVVVTGTQPLSFQWYKGERGDTSQPVAGANAASLTTPVLAQTTRYWVRVSNAAGTVDSRTVTVTLAPDAPPLTPPQIVSQPQDLSVTGGTTVTLSVVVTGTQPLSFQWYEGERGDTSQPVAGATNASLTLPQLLRTTTYWVRVSNAAGTVDSRTTRVAVMVVDAWPGAYLPFIVR